jgi:MYXO-CTERM domain-containing protein
MVSQRRSTANIVAIACALLGLAAATPAHAQEPVQRTRYALPASNGYGAIILNLDAADPSQSRRLVHFREHLYSVEEPLLDAAGNEIWNGSDFAAAFTRDLLYDAYFGLRDGNGQAWLPSQPVDLDASGYAEGGSGVVTMVQSMGALEATQFFFAPMELEGNAFVMAMRVHNTGGIAVPGPQAFSLHNFHLGYGRATSSFGVGQDIGENGETLLWDGTGGGAAFTERGFAGVVAMRAVGDVAHYGAAPAVDVYGLVNDGGFDDLPDNPTPDMAATGATGALQFDLGDLAPGQETWVAVTFVHHGDPFAGAAALGLADGWIAGRNAQQLVEDELAGWADFQAALTMPAGQSADEEALTRQSAAMLRMGQVHEEEFFLREWLSQDGEIRRTRFPGALPGTVQHLGAGAILASLPPGNWTYAWIRDGAYATAAMATLGMGPEARAALEFYLNAEAGRFVDWMELSAYDMPDYQISLVRYYGFGVEETDFNAFGPNLEFDGFGLFLWALRAYEEQTGDEALADEYWPVISERVADVLVALVDPITGLIRRDSSIWESHWNGRERYWAYTTITAARGLCDAAAIAERVGDQARADTYRETAMGLRQAIVDQLTDSGGAIGSTMEEVQSGAGYWDASVVDALAMGLFDPAGDIASATLGGLDNNLVTPASEVGWARNDDATDHLGGRDLSPWGSTYDSVEWVITDLRGSMAFRAAGYPERADGMLAWILAQSQANYRMVAETYNATTGIYENNTPMLGFGAGAWALAMAHRAGDYQSAACGEFWEGGSGETSGGETTDDGTGEGTSTGTGLDDTASDSGPGGTSLATLSAGLDESSGDPSNGAGEDDSGGCGCRTRGAGAPWPLLALLAALGLRRRHRGTVARCNRSRTACHTGASGGITTTILRTPRASHARSVS